ncbi:uncharacterized protein METZ01_LOCUS379746, partial [marine metagenome]
VLPVCFLFGIMLVALGGQVLFPPEITAEGIIPHPSIGAKSSEVDQIVIVMIQRVVPEMLGITFGAVVVTLILIAVLAASMSTADSNLHALSAVLTRDVYDRFIRPQADERERTWVGRIVIVLATMAAVALVEWSQKAGAFNPLELISQLMLVAIAFSSQLLPIAIDVLFLNKGTRKGAISGLTAGIGLVLLLTIKPEWSFGLTKIVHVSAVGIAANAIVFGFVSRATKKVPQKRIDEFRRIIKAKG